MWARATAPCEVQPGLFAVLLPLSPAFLSRERKAILQQRPHLLRLEGELRSLQATDLTSCLQKMRMEMHLVLEARGALCSRRVRLCWAFVRGICR